MQDRDLTRAVRCALFASAVGLCTQVADAADYRFEPRLQVGGQYNDNYRLTPDNENAVKGAMADVSARWRAITPTSELNITPRILATYFPDDRNEDDTDGYLTLGYGHTGLKSRFNLDGYYSHENLQTSEQPAAGGPDTGLGGGTGVESGNTATHNKRDLLRLAPTLSYDLTQKQSLEAGLEYYMADYQHDTLDSNTDFKSIGGTLGLGFKLTPRHRLIVAATGTHFDPDTPLTGKTNSYGLRGEWWTDHTQTMQTYLRLGAERTKEDDPEIGEAPDASTNVVIGAGIKAEYQLTKIFADYTHGVRPNASGELVTRDDLRVRVRREFTQKLGGFIGVLGARDEAANDNAEFRDRRYYTGSVGMEWRLTPVWSIVGAYDYRHQKRDLEGTASSNQLVLSVVWEPQRRQ